MFQKKKPVFAEVKKPEEEFELESEEDPEILALQEKLDSLKNPRKAVVQRVQEPLPVLRKPIQYQEQNTATIISSELLDDGKIRTVILSYGNLGYVGETFEV